MRANIALSVLAVGAAAVALLGCASLAPPPAEPQPDLSVAGATLSAAQVRPESTTPAALSVRISGIAAVLAGAEVSGITPEDVSKALSTTPGRAEVLIEDARRIHIHLDAARSEMLAVHGVVADDFTSTTDIGAVRARAVFDGAIKALVSKQLIESDGLAIEKVRIGKVMQAETQRGGVPTTRLKEYFFEVPRVVGGVEVFGSNVTISVHRSGLLASIRTAGPPVSLAKDSTFTRASSAVLLTERARREHPGAEVVPLGLRYPWAATRADAAVTLRPREAFRVVPVTVADDRTIRGRAHYVFYAVDDEKEPPLVSPRPNPGATGDTGK